MTYLPKQTGAKEIDLTEWEFGYGDLDPVIAKGFAEALTSTFNDRDYGGITADFKYEDLGIIEIDLPLSAEGGGVTYELSLSDLVAEWIEYSETATAGKMRDKFTELAAIIHRAHFPKEDIPRFDIENAELPAFFKSNLDLDLLWNWDTYASPDHICQALEHDIEAAKSAIARLREQKVRLETALIHYKARRAAPVSKAAEA